ncbi:MAG: uncharacterized coiled-coil DUF342 family protein [Candidatus Poseidoniaceae archaeon]|jgi:uncharacterized coiled-coil DUF342 family protein
MRPEELLEMTPALLAKSILHRRERLAETIPEQLDARQEELRAAEPLARSAKEQRDGINAKVANLKKERNASRMTAQKLYQEGGELRDKISSSGGVQKSNPEWAQNKLNDKLKALEHELETNWGDHKTEQKFLTEMKSQIRQHEEWVGNRTDNQEEHALMTTKFAEARKHLEVAEKAHKALLDHASENEYFHNTYLEQESHRRRADARTKRLAQALDSSQRGIEHWQKHIDEGFDQLLTNSKRVENGEPSSHARRRQQKSPEKKKQSPSSRNKKKQQPRGEEE